MIKKTLLSANNFQQLTNNLISPKCPKMIPKNSFIGQQLDPLLVQNKISGNERRLAPCGSRMIAQDWSMDMEMMKFCHFGR